MTADKTQQQNVLWKADGQGTTTLADQPQVEGGMQARKLGPAVTPGTFKKRDCSDGSGAGRAEHRE